MAQGVKGLGIKLLVAADDGPPVMTLPSFWSGNGFILSRGACLRHRFLLLQTKATPMSFGFTAVEKK